MIEYTRATTLNLTEDYKIIRTNKKREYINLPCGFDIETTSIKNGDTKSAFMYVWALGIGHGTAIYYGRTWSDLAHLLDRISNHFELLDSEDRRLIIYVHNLGYEFQFMRKYFEWLDVFAVDERKPIKALCSLGIEFRDSYILSGYSLENTAKNLTAHKIDKKVGDLDYSLTRHHTTPLSADELGYCKADIEIITAYISEQIALYGDISKIPATNTGRVRKYVKDQCYYTSKNHRKSGRGKYTRYRQIMADLTLTPENYIQSKRAFMGGFTHANSQYSGQTLENVTSIDFTSSYPSVMVSEQFPMSRFKPVKIQSLDQLKNICGLYCVIMDIKFINLSPKIEQENYISESKCFALKGSVINNGRVSFAEELGITITEIDLQIIEQAYDWEAVQIGSVVYAHKQYLPKSIVQSILNLYQKKTELKDVAGYETEYLLSKGMLNSVYGMSVTDIVKDNSIYSDKWEVEKVDLETEISEYNESRNRFLYYPWGVWVTAYARRNLWTGIIAAGNDYVYSDTDSLKLLNYGNHKEYIEYFNRGIIKRMNACLDFHGLDKNLLSPKTKEGKIKIMGVWDFEGTYERFKTLGAKRYLYQSGDKLQLTVAGLSKQNGINYMIEQSGGDYGAVFNMFNDDLYIPAERTGKMTHTYIDEPQSLLVTDYTGKTEEVHAESSIHLEPCDFTLSIAEQYKQFLQQLAKGYIYRGVKHV